MKSHDLLSVNDEVTTRFLEKSEIPIRPGSEQGPLVIEAKEAKDIAFLQGFLSKNADAVKKSLYAHGAVLLRGFNIENNLDFETAISSIQGFRAMNDYFMSEPGRSKMSKETRVFYTNKYFKTGGGFALGGFHSENFYTPDVPAVISFWCRKAPRLGGETGLVHTANMYEELPAELKSRLESEAVLSYSFPISQIAERYPLAEEHLCSFLKAAGLKIVNAAANQLNVYKPTIMLHQYTKRKSIQLHFGDQLAELDVLLRKKFIALYPEAKWALHRLIWRHGSLYAAVRLFMLSRLILRPRILSIFLPVGKSKKMSESNSDKLRTKLTDKDIESLAEALWRHCYGFTWKKNDILILDNLQMLHSGMPGWGSRELRVMLCNPIRLSCAPGAGLAEVSPEDGHESLDVRLRALSHPAPSG